MRTSTIVRRDLILDAALSCFDELGYEATGVQEIRARSGASIGSIYHHFAGKEQIAGELFVAGIASYQRALTEVEPVDAQRWVRGLVRAQIRWCEREPRMARFLAARTGLHGTAPVDAALQELNRDFFGHLRSTMEPWQASGELMVLPLEIFAAVVTGPVLVFTRRWLAGESKGSLREAERLLAASAWGAVRADPPGAP